MKQLKIAVCRISPESQADCKHFHGMYGQGIEDSIHLCKFTEKCPDQIILQPPVRHRTPKTKQENLFQETDFDKESKL